MIQVPLKKWLAGGVAALTFLAGASFAAEAPAAGKQRNVVYGSQITNATSYIWTDKITYRVGDPITVKWTSNPNGDNDARGYTFFFFLQDNTTGKRIYFPGAGENPTDMDGRTPGQYQPAQIPVNSKSVLVGQGGRFGAFAAPNLIGMHTFVLEIRDFAGTVIARRAYAKFAIVEGEETISGDITSNRTLSNRKAYVLSGGVFVMSGATLTVEPGTVIYGADGALSFLAITQGGKINAGGTRARPIIMTSRRPVGQRARGDWGGLVINGRAPINFPGGTAISEGIDDPVKGRYGGTDPNDNSGVLRYVRVEYAGFRITPTNELNGIAFQGVGKGTKVEYVQSTFGADDALEWFGGTVDGKYLVASFEDDDMFDWTFGWNGRIQFAFGLQRGDICDMGIEADNNEDGFDLQPRSNPTIYNMTLLGDPRTATSRSNIGVLLRRGTAAKIYNLIVQGFYRGTGFDINDQATFDQANSGNIRLTSAVFWKNKADSTNRADQFAADTLGVADGQDRLFVQDPLIRKPTDMNDPDPRPYDYSLAVLQGLFTVPPDDSEGFWDTTVNFIGAFSPYTAPWTDEWTNFINDSDVN